MITKERPILFSGPMVKAILAGIKTMTRRAVKPQPIFDGQWWRHKTYSCGGEQGFREGMPFFGNCPYGNVGDRLWVRENSAYAEAENGNELRVYQADRAVADVYQLDCGPKSLNGFHDANWIDERNGKLKYTPSIHMPRWASRITLEITDVRVERLQEISEQDAIAEGSQIPIASFSPPLGGCLTERTAFARIWERINGPGAWELNPWVWVVSFKRTSVNTTDVPPAPSPTPSLPPGAP